MLTLFGVLGCIGWVAVKRAIGMIILDTVERNMNVSKYIYICYQVRLDTPIGRFLPIGIHCPEKSPDRDDRVIVIPCGDDYQSLANM